MYQAFRNAEARGMPPVPVNANGELAADNVAHAEPWRSTVREEFECICDNESLWRQTKHSLWWSSVGICKNWHIGAVLNWVAWERKLGIDLEGRLSGDFFISPASTATGREQDLLLMPAAMPGTFRLRQPPNAD